MKLKYCERHKNSTQNANFAFCDWKSRAIAKVKNIENDSNWQHSKMARFQRSETILTIDLWQTEPNSYKTKMDDM